MRKIYLPMVGFIFATILNILTNGNPTPTTIISAYLLFAALLLFTGATLFGEGYINRGTKEQHKKIEYSFGRAGFVCIAAALFILSFMFSWLFSIVCTIAIIAGLSICGVLTNFMHEETVHEGKKS